MVCEGAVCDAGDSESIVGSVLGEAGLLTKDIRGESRGFWQNILGVGNNLGESRASNRIFSRRIKGFR